MAGGAGRTTDITISNGNVHVVCDATPGYAYQLQRGSGVGTRWWDDKGTAVVATATATKHSAAQDRSCDFFRVLEFTNSVFWYDWEYRYQTPYLSSWGLGITEDSYVHVDRACDWYINQADTGAASGNNCGPSTTTMAIKWHDPSFSQTAEDARDWSYSWRTNGWWDTSDIANYLNLHAVPNTISAYTGTGQLRGLVAEGRLVLLCIDTKHLTRNTSDEQRIGRFYNYASGHFLVVKGVRSVSGTPLIEVYDSNSWWATYADGTLKGKNRHLTGSDMTEAITNWWNYIIVVDAPAAKGGKSTTPQKSNFLVPVDPATIRHARGR